MGGVTASHCLFSQDFSQRKIGLPCNLIQRGKQTVTHSFFVSQLFT